AESVVHLFALPGCKRVRSFTGRTGIGKHLAFSPDAKRLAGVTEKGEVQVWDLTANREMRTVGAPEGAFCSLAFCGKGRLKVCSRDGTMMTVSDAFNGTRVSCTSGHQVGVRALAFLGDREILSVSAWGEAITWDAGGRLQRQRQLRPIDRH